MEKKKLYWTLSLSFLVIFFIARLGYGVIKKIIFSLLNFNIDAENYYLSSGILTMFISGIFYALLIFESTRELDKKNTLIVWLKKTLLYDLIVVIYSFIALFFTFSFWLFITPIFSTFILILFGLNMYILILVLLRKWINKKVIFVSIITTGIYLLGGFVRYLFFRLSIGLGIPQTTVIRQLLELFISIGIFYPIILFGTVLINFLSERFIKFNFKNWPIGLSFIFFILFIIPYTLDTFRLIPNGTATDIAQISYLVAYLVATFFLFAIPKENQELV